MFQVQYPNFKTNGNYMFTYREAITTATHLLKELEGTCVRAQIVGSLRRLRPEVNDIDIITIPEFSFEETATLFGDTVEQNLLDLRLAGLCNGDQYMMQSNGPKIKRLLIKTSGTLVPVDIYIASESTWWTLLLIRTGSRNHNIALARRALEKHMVLKADGTGLLTAGGDIIPISSEEDIFRHLNLSFCSPEERG